jgi:glycosyltransferase involved in cell wall biosynthesis
MAAKRITVSVISDLTTDQRVIRISSTLQQMGFNVTVIARAFNNSLPLDNYNFEATRIHCWFRKGFMQYAEFNLKLFFKLLFSKTDYFLANDLDVLLPNYLAANWRNKKIFYDTHEYFTGVPELRNSPAKRKIWKALEDRIFPRLPVVYTVNDSVKHSYEKEYGNTIGVIRNVPVTVRPMTREMPADWADKKILLMQGAGINVGRGGLELLEAIRLLSDEYLLVYIGSGTQWDTIAQKRIEWKLEGKVVMIGKLPPAQLQQYTGLAHIGFSLDSFDDINYLFNLPNKIFDYIHAGVPLIATAIPEVERIVETHQCGICIPDSNPATIAAAITRMLDNKDAYERFKLNCMKAARLLCWENESEILKAIYQPYL